MNRSFDTLLENLRTIHRKLDRLTESVDHIMSDQSHLDTDITALSGYFADIEAEVANLKAQPAADALDFTALDALVASAKAADPGPAPAAPLTIDATTTNNLAATSPDSGSAPTDPGAAAPVDDTGTTPATQDPGAPGDTASAPADVPATDPAPSTDPAVSADPTTADPTTDPPAPAA